jgi:predicted acylesterase/phospholipase RssA
MRIDWRIPSPVGITGQSRARLGALQVMPMPTAPSRPASVIFQAGKLGHIPQVLEEFDWARTLAQGGRSIDRVYGVSGGALTAAAFALQQSAALDPRRFGGAASALDQVASFLRRARSRELRSINLNPTYGPFNLHPLRKRIARWLEMQLGRSDLTLSELPLRLYLCAADRDGTLTLFGAPNDSLQFKYGFVRVGPPQEALLLDALIAALSTSLSTEPARIRREWYRDCRPAVADARAIVADLEMRAPRPILCRRPYTPPPTWKLNWISSSFIMHRHHEQNQALLARYYCDLLQRHRALEERIQSQPGRTPGGRGGRKVGGPIVHHVDLPYVGSTEAFTNMRQSVAEKESLMAQFRQLLEGQLDSFPFDQPANIIYGAGGFSGILAGLVTTRAVEAGFARGGGEIRQIYGVSAGVLNGFFHAVQVAALRHPDLYRPAARHALTDLESFFATIEPKKIARVNRCPRDLWIGWANLGPLEAFLLERLAAYTGSPRAAQITFDDIGLPLTVAAARNDGLTDFLGTTHPARHLRLDGVELTVRRAPVVRAVIAGWSMNTYILPTVLEEQAYRDGGGSFYDPGMLVACLDRHLVNLLNIHLDEPVGHSYNLPPRPNLVRLLFDTHNYTFPEERRRMRRLTDLLFAHYRLREEWQARATRGRLAPDFRQRWDVGEESIG